MDIELTAFTTRRRSLLPVRRHFTHVDEIVGLSAELLGNDGILRLAGLCRLTSVIVPSGVDAAGLVPILR